MLFDYYLDIVHYDRNTGGIKRPYLVAALDILGFSNYVMRSSIHRDFEFDDVFPILSKMKTVENTFSQSNPPMVARFFSDCIFLLFPLDYSPTSSDCSAYYYFWETIADLVEIALSQGFLIRGGMSIGECNVNKGLMWGPGIIKAHFLEEKVAKTGRIIIEDRDFQQLNKYARYVFEDMSFMNIAEYFVDEKDGSYAFDSTLFILSILYAEYEQPNALRQFKKLLATVKENTIETSTDDTVEKHLQKLSWYIERYNSFAEIFGQPTVTLDSLRL